MSKTKKGLKLGLDYENAETNNWFFECSKNYSMQWFQHSALYIYTNNLKLFIDSLEANYRVKPSRRAVLVTKM